MRQRDGSWRARRTFQHFTASSPPRWLRCSQRMPLAQRAVADLLGPMLPLGGTQPTASMNIFWRWSPHLHSGKPCKTLVAKGLSLVVLPCATTKSNGAVFASS